MLILVLTSLILAIYMLKRIYDDGYFRFTLHTPLELSSPDILVITFQSLNGKISDHGFGTEFLRSFGYQVLFVSHKGKSHYQKLSLELFKEVVSDFIINKDVFLYGSSTGGYAAIYYSGVINGQSICLSPRCDIDPIYTNDIKQDCFNHFILNEIPQNLLSSKAPIVAYDPLVYKDELFMSERVLPAYPNSQVWKIPNAFHPVGPAMKNAGVLKRFVLDAIEHNKLTDICEIDPVNSPKFLLKLAERELKEGNIASFNDAVFRCLSLGGHRTLFRIMYKALSKRILCFHVSKSDFPPSMLKGFTDGFVKNPNFNPDLRHSNHLINLSLYVFDFEAALFNVDVKMRICGSSKELKVLRNKILSNINYMAGLPKPSFNN